MTNGPVLIDLENEDRADVTLAAPVPDPGPEPASGRAMLAAGRVATRRPSRLSRWFWGLLGALLGALISVSVWNFISGIVARSPVLGAVMTGLAAAFLLVTLAVVLREIAGIGRIRRVDGVRRAAQDALAGDDTAKARQVTGRLLSLYRGRDDVNWGRDRFEERIAEQVDAYAVLALAEAELLEPLDAAASREIETAARQVATVTALVPLAFADVAAALMANLRMIRRISEVYGGRSGFIGSWRLTRTVFAHLMATGAVAVGDDFLEPVLGGSVLSKLSRRFGEGLVNGALCARVGVAAMDVCRPLPFVQTKRPSVRQLVRRALTGLFGRGSEPN